MREINAVELRQSVGKLAKSLERTGDPVLLKVGRRPAGVIISLRDFEERFALKDAEGRRAKLVEEILADQQPGEVPVDQAITDLRQR